MPSLHSQTDPARVLIVDDHPVLCRSIRRHLEEDATLSVCGVVHEAITVPGAVEDLKPDVVLLDLTLGEDDGLVVARDIRIEHATLPILILSIHRESHYAGLALQAGANGYLMKSDAPEDLLTALHTVLEGRTHLSSDMIHSQRKG